MILRFEVRCWVEGLDFFDIAVFSRKTPILVYSHGQGLFYKTKQVLSKLVSRKMLSAVTGSLGKTELVAVNS